MYNNYYYIYAFFQVLLFLMCVHVFCCCPSVSTNLNFELYMLKALRFITDSADMSITWPVPIKFWGIIGACWNNYNYTPSILKKISCSNISPVTCAQLSQLKNG